MSDLGDFTRSSSTGSTTETDTDRFEESSITSTGTDVGIGTIPASQGLKIAEEGDDTEIQASITASNRSDIRLGKYLLLSYPDDEKLFCRITGL
jgi:hypothetical protein